MTAGKSDWSLDNFTHCLKWLLSDEYGDILAEPLQERIREDVIHLVAKLERGEMHR